MVPFIYQPLEMETVSISEEEVIPSDEVECSLSLEQMRMLQEEQEDLDRLAPETDAVMDVVMLDELGLVGDVLMKVDGADKDKNKFSSAARALFTIRHTNLFDLFVAQAGNEEAVNRLLEEYVDEEGRLVERKKER